MTNMWKEVQLYLSCKLRYNNQINELYFLENQSSRHQNNQNQVSFNTNKNEKN